MPLFHRSSRPPPATAVDTPPEAPPDAPPAPPPAGSVAGDASPAAPVRPAHFPVTEGSLPCRDRGCPNHNGVLCNYVDRRGRSCQTAWCPNHWASVGGIVYCRRHAGTLAAIGYFDHPLGMPDIDNRAPSLVHWVSRDLDGFIATTLAQSAFPGETFVREPLVTIHNDHATGRRYERSWKLVDHTGLRITVWVFINEADDATVRVKVGSTVVAEGVPPWIERRRRDLQVSAEVDRTQRTLFYAFLQKHILAAVRANREADAQLRGR